MGIHSRNFAVDLGTFDSNKKKKRKKKCNQHERAVSREHAKRDTGGVSLGVG